MGAVFSEDRVYRYSLTREVNALGTGTCVFCLVNSSTAGEETEDPTSRRCKGFARAWGYRYLEIVNPFAYCGSDPQVLKQVDDPVGPDNDKYIREAARRSGIFIVGWGVHGALYGRGKQVMKIIEEEGVTPYYLGLTKAGYPRHPLYLLKTATPQIYTPNP